MDGFDTTRHAEFPNLKNHLIVSSLFTDEDTEAPKERKAWPKFSHWSVTDSRWELPTSQPSAVTSHNHMLEEMMGNAQQI